MSIDTTQLLNNAEWRKKKRGIWLTIFLLAQVAFSLFNTYEAIQNFVVQQATLSAISWSVYSIANGTAVFVFALAIWNWKRWGVYGEIGLGIVQFVVYLSLADFLSALLNLGGFLVLILLIRRVWSFLD